MDYNLTSKYLRNEYWNIVHAAKNATIQIISKSVISPGTDKLLNQLLEKRPPFSAALPLLKVKVMI